MGVCRLLTGPQVGCVCVEVTGPQVGVWVYGGYRSSGRGVGVWRLQVLG